jgi:hypothetical protein
MQTFGGHGHREALDPAPTLLTGFGAKLQREQSPKWSCGFRLQPAGAAQWVVKANRTPEGAQFVRIRPNRLCSERLLLRREVLGCLTRPGDQLAEEMGVSKL